MLVKRCAVCKRPSYNKPSDGLRKKNWLCPACTRLFESWVTAGIPTGTGEACQNCTKRTRGCRFSVLERLKITACSDWTGKNTEHDRRRWAKFEIQED